MLPTTLQLMTRNGTLANSVFIRNRRALRQHLLATASSNTISRVAEKVARMPDVLPTANAGRS
jgi:hypothetical protein